MPGTIGENADLFIGIGYTLNKDFEGLIDEVRIYDYALDATEVAQLYEIPEPATICLFALAGFMLRRRK